MISFICNDLEKLSKNLLKLFIKPEVIDKCTSPKQLKEIDVRKKENLVKKKISAETRLSSLYKKERIWLFTGKFIGKNPRTVTSWISYCTQCICIGFKRYSYDFYGRTEKKVDIKCPHKFEASCKLFFQTKL